MKKYLLPLVLFAGYSFSQQNLKDNYTPLKSSGQLPDVFTQNIRNVIQNDISELNKNGEKDRSLKSTYLLEANYEIEKIVKSGNALINDEVTNYLNKLADVILKNNPALRNELHIYTLKSPVVNAYSYDKGYIFIDVGLIAQVETEAQLAYILCHEISHYTKKHHINGYVQNKKLDRKNYDRNSEEKLIEKCQYSKESESEADVEGFRMFEQTDYNLKQAEKAFDVLQYAHLPFELVEFKKTFFELEKYKLPNGYFLKDVSSIKNNSNEDDTKLTHPNTAKRKQAIGDLIANRSNSGKVNAVVGQTQFEYIRDISRLELCRLYLKRRDYPNALYAAYILQTKYPNNQYVVETIAKCMYALSLYGKGKVRYNSDSYLENGIPSHSDVESYPQQLYHLVNKMPANEWTIMSLNYVYRAHKKFPSSQILTAYSDSLFKMMGQINWGIKDFVRLEKKEEVVKKVQDSIIVKDEGSSKTDMIATIQKENNFKNYDTAYYKEAYVDLFVNDKEFVGKFPASGIDDGTVTSSGFSSYSSGNSPKNTEVKKKKKKKSKHGEYINSENKIQKVLLLEPFYFKIDESKEDEYQYLTSDKKQENYIVTVNKCAEKQNFALVTLDPGLISPGEVDKLNDYSTINDWFSEKFDSDNGEAPIFNTNEINALIAKYGTQYVLKTGIVNYKSKRGRKRTYFYAFVYDIKNNEMVYKKFETFRDKDAKDLVHAKIYQSLYELKHAK
ncbi:MAG: M48 family metallopeptidase [Bacteroidota bacterium]